MKTVTVYHDPITKKKKEDAATVLKQIKPSGINGLTLCKVQFPDGFVTMRLVDNEQLEE